MIESEKSGRICLAIIRAGSVQVVLSAKPLGSVGENHECGLHRTIPTLSEFQTSLEHTSCLAFFCHRIRFYIVQG